MGYAQKRVGRDGKPRYTAVYHNARGERRSAGTYSSKRDADKAWQQAELRLAEGRHGDPRPGPADLPAVRQPGVAASSRDRDHHPGGVHLPAQ